MKIRTLILVVVLFIVVSLSFAEDKISVDDIYGTWVNSDYNIKAQYAEIIIDSDGTIKRYSIETDTEPKCQGKYTVTDSWHDRKGNLWIKFNYNTTGGRTFYVLSKYSNSGRVWEWVDSEKNYPTEMSPIAGNYGIYYRQ